MSGELVEKRKIRSINPWQLNALLRGNVLGSLAGDAGPHAFAAVFNGASSALYTDGSSSFTGNVGALTGTGTMGIGANSGGTSGAGCDICEMLDFNKALTAGEITQLTVYSRNQWATP